MLKLILIVCIWLGLALILGLLIGRMADRRDHDR